MKVILKETIFSMLESNVNVFHLKQEADFTKIM